MNRFYVALSGLLIVGGVVSALGHAWGLVAILLILGLGLLVSEGWTQRKRRFIPLENGPDAEMERTKAQGLQNFQLGAGRPLPDPPPPTRRVISESQGRRPSSQ